MAELNVTDSGKGDLQKRLSLTQSAGTPPSVNKKISETKRKHFPFKLSSKSFRKFPQTARSKLQRKSSESESLVAGFSSVSNQAKSSPGVFKNIRSYLSEHTPSKKKLIKEGLPGTRSALKKGKKIHNKFTASVIPLEVVEKKQLSKAELLENIIHTFQSQIDEIPSLPRNSQIQKIANLYEQIDELHAQDIIDQDIKISLETQLSSVEKNLNTNTFSVQKTRLRKAPAPPHLKPSNEVAEEALSIITEAKEWQDSGFEFFYVGNQEYPIPKPDQYGITTWKFKIDGKECLVKEHNTLDPDYYNGVKTEDFITQSNLMFETALAYSLGRGETFLQDIKEHHEATSKRLTEECSIDPKIMQKGGENAVQYYTKQHEKALDIMAEEYNYLENQLQAVSRDQNLSLAELQTKQVQDRNRPMILNTYKAFAGSNTHFDMQIPLGSETIPSSVRDSEKLCNYVLTCSGTVGSNGEVVTTLEATRYSRPTPISIENSYQRQALAAQNIKQDISTEMRRRVEKEGLPPSTSKEKPLKIKMSAMMLFTPKRLDQVRQRKYGVFGKWKGESEQMQLKESVQAMNLYEGRPIKMNIRGKDVWVEVEWTEMNMGANPPAVGVGWKGEMPNHPLQSRINAHGFLRFEKDASSTILMGLNDFENNPNTPTKTRSIINQIKERKLDIAKAYDQKIIGLTKKYESEQSTLLKQLSPKREIAAQLNMSYLEALKQAPPDKKIIKKLTKEIKKNNEEIKALEKKQYSSAQQLMRAKRSLYLRNQTAIEHLVNNDDPENLGLNQLFDRLDASLEGAPNLQKQATRLKDIQSNANQFRQGFFNKIQRSPKTATKLQAIFIQTQSEMGNAIRFYCKSAEDRTGMVEEHVKAREAFTNDMGHVPSNQNEETTVAEGYRPLAHEAGSSLENTRENSNARGLQVSDRLVPENMKVETKCGKMSGTMIKEIPKRAKSLRKKESRRKKPQTKTTRKKEIRTDQMSLREGVTHIHKEYKERFIALKNLSEEEKKREIPKLRDGLKSLQTTQSALLTQNQVSNITHFLAELDSLEQEIATKEFTKQLTSLQKQFKDSQTLSLEEKTLFYKELGTHLTQLNNNSTFKASLENSPKLQTQMKTLLQNITPYLSLDKMNQQLEMIRHAPDSEKKGRILELLSQNYQKLAEQHKKTLISDFDLGEATHRFVEELNAELLRGSGDSGDEIAA